MRIGELERRTGVSQRLLRYYEEQGLLRPRRLPSGYRVYDETDVTTVAQIRNLLAAGLSTATIADMLPCLATEGGRLVADCPELLIELYQERRRITSAITELTEAMRTLDTVIATAPPDVAEKAAAQLT
ncbi:MerR family transcriptional regulator [Amycolatopsis suaedae]|uniref:MerR family transcriptional regulator n=1 Tax=Amycolatopsis suaedae TaxID=2510978 RepID=A0A4Q7JEB1_9PSEU|nr:MerR family transcriptional regulator [Amycolatopsis suaedae]RZQ65416.1 MerR family transcriptional regulator [Amycolatopsis suaedae]